MHNNILCQANIYRYIYHYDTKKKPIYNMLQVLTQVPVTCNLHWKEMLVLVM